MYFWLNWFNKVLNFPRCCRFRFYIWKGVVKSITQIIYWSTVLSLLSLLLLLLLLLLPSLPLSSSAAVAHFYLNQREEIFIQCNYDILWIVSRFTTNIQILCFLINTFSYHILILQFPKWWSALSAYTKEITFQCLCFLLTKRLHCYSDECAAKIWTKVSHVQFLNSISLIPGIEKGVLNFFVV